MEIGKMRDQRMDHRHTLILEAEVHFREECVEGMFRCKTSNIGLRGAFLPSHDIPIEYETEVELVLLTRSTSASNQHRLKAKVIRNTDTGAALSFPLLDFDQMRDFRRFLLRAKIAARPFP